jgi:tetratricopeptide (TPR) repeat protein
MPYGDRLVELRLVVLGLATVLVGSASTRAAHGAQDSAALAKSAYARAIDLEAKGNDSAALSLLWQAAGLAPRDAEVQNRLGEALLRLGALDAAVDAFQRALSARPDFQKAANNFVLTLVQAGRGPEALQRARAFIAAAPDDPNRDFTLGLVQSEQDVEGAIGTFRRVLERAPRHTLARYNLALVLQRADRLSEAIGELDRAIEIEPRPEAYYTLGVIYWHQGDLDRAVKALGAAIAAQPGYAAAHYTLGAVLKDRREWARAAESFRRAIALRPDLTGAYVTLAEVLRLQGDDTGARAQLAEGERLRRRGEIEHQALVWTAVGARKLDAGDLTGALDDFRRATATFDGYAPAHFQLGLVLRRLGQPEASRAAFARAQQLNPSLVPPPYSP